jgi:hypothetical protein
MPTFSCRLNEVKHSTGTIQFASANSRIRQGAVARYYGANATTPTGLPANGAKTPIVVHAVDIRSSAAARNLICSRSASVTLLHSPGARGASNRNRKARARTLKSKKRPQPRGRCWGRHAAHVTGRLSRFPKRRNAGPVPIAAACFDPQCPDHKNRKTPISKPAANAQRPNVQAETMRTRIRRSCGISWDRSVIAAAPPSQQLLGPSFLDWRQAKPQFQPRLSGLRH